MIRGSGLHASGDAQVDETAAEIGLRSALGDDAWGSRPVGPTVARLTATMVQLCYIAVDGASAATAVSSRQLAGSLGAMFRVCGNGNCPLTGMLSIGNTAVAPIPAPAPAPAGGSTHYRRRRRCARRHQPAESQVFSHPLFPKLLGAPVEVTDYLPY